MKGAYLDSIFAAARGRKRQTASIQSENMKLLATHAGVLRVLDTESPQTPITPCA
jgi:hypothetical protein